MPQVVDEVYYANDVGLTLGAIGFALMILRRYPTGAGVLLGLCWVKPQVALPLAVLVVLFHAPQRTRLALGFVAGTLLLFTAPILGSGWNLWPEWIGALLTWSHDLRLQYNVASIAGLYIHTAPLALRTVLEGVAILLAAGATAFWWLRYRIFAAPPPAVLALLWAVWFLAAPYAHFYDEPLLALPVLALMGRDGFRLGTIPSAVVLYALLLSVVLTLAKWHSAAVMLHCVPVLALAAALGAATLRPTGLGEANPQPSLGAAGP
jgi:hypothetical protein